MLARKEFTQYDFKHIAPNSLILVPAYSLDIVPRIGLMTGVTLRNIDESATPAPGLSP